jgi:hypothetical protein
MENKTRGIGKKRWKVERVNNSHMERQVDEKFIKKTLSRLRCSSKVAGSLASTLDAVHRRGHWPQPIQSLPTGCRAKRRYYFKRNLRRREKRNTYAGGGDYSSCRLDLTSKTTFRYMNGKKEKRKNFWFFSLYLFPFHLFKGPQETEFHHRTA